MIILIDSGNSRIKLGWLKLQGIIRHREPTSVTIDRLALPELEKWLSSLPTKPCAAIGVNVAGEWRASAIAALLQQYHCSIHWVKAQAEVANLINLYREPTQLGADRWVAQVGVLSHLPKKHPPFILACFGTATTIDTVGPDNVFHGGLIVPGLNMMRQVLSEKAEGLPLAESGPSTPYPNNTQIGINSGIASAQAGALVRQWLVGWKYYRRGPAVYASGGSWPDVAMECKCLLNTVSSMTKSPTKIYYLENPVLDGLAVLATHHKRLHS